MTDIALAIVIVGAVTIALVIDVAVLIVGGASWWSKHS
jgi:hypothetical protein